MRQNLKVELFRSPALYESDTPVVPEGVPDQIFVGPFEYVQMTYETITVQRPDEDMPDIVWADLSDGLWYVEDYEYPFSDVIVSAWDEE